MGIERPQSAEQTSAPDRAEAFRASFEEDLKEFCATVEHSPASERSRANELIQNAQAVLTRLAQEARVQPTHDDIHEALNEEWTAAHGLMEEMRWERQRLEGLAQNKEQS